MERFFTKEEFAEALKIAATKKSTKLMVNLTGYSCHAWFDFYFTDWGNDGMYVFYQREYDRFYYDRDLYEKEWPSMKKDYVLEHLDEIATDFYNCDLNREEVYYRQLQEEDNEWGEEDGDDEEEYGKDEAQMSLFD